MKSVQIRSYFWSIFSCIQSEYRKTRTRNNSVFGYFSRSETALLELKLTPKPALFLFWKVFSYFKLIISEYLDQIPPWKEIKDAFSVKLQTESLFSKDKIKQNSGYPNKEYNPVIKYIH